MQHAVPSDWLHENGLLYRLDPTGSFNVDEINITQVNGSRKPEGRSERATQLLAVITAGVKALQEQQQEEARCNHSSQ